MFFVLFILGVLEVVALIERSSIIISRTETNKDIISDSTIFNLGDDYEFNFAFSLVIGGADIIADTSYIETTLEQVVQTRLTSGVLIETTTSIPYEKCGNQFNDVDKSTATIIGIDDYYCPAPTSTYSIQGSFYSETYRYIKLNIRYCSSGGCQSTADIETLLGQGRVQLAVLNNYVDFRNYNSPVTTFIVDGQYWDLVPGTRKRSDVFVQKNKATFEDGVFTFDDQSEESFYQIPRSRDRFSRMSTSNNVLSVYFRRDTQTTEFRRQVYTIIDSLAKIGGFFRIMSFAVELALVLFVENLFYSKLMNSLYQLDADHGRVYMSDSDNDENAQSNIADNPVQEEGGSKDNISNSKIYFL